MLKLVHAINSMLKGNLKIRKPLKCVMYSISKSYKVFPNNLSTCTFIPSNVGGET